MQIHCRKKLFDLNLCMQRDQGEVYLYSVTSVFSCYLHIDCDGQRLCHMKDDAHEKQDHKKMLTITMMKIQFN